MCRLSTSSTVSCVFSHWTFTCKISTKIKFDINGTDDYRTILLCAGLKFKFVRVFIHIWLVTASFQCLGNWNEERIVPCHLGDSWFFSRMEMKNRKKMYHSVWCARGKIIHHHKGSTLDIALLRWWSSVLPSNILLSVDVSKLLCHRDGIVWILYL